MLMQELQDLIDKGIFQTKVAERKKIASRMCRRDVGGVNPEWALSDKDYQCLKRGEEVR